MKRSATVAFADDTSEGKREEGEEEEDALGEREECSQAPVPMTRTVPASLPPLPPKMQLPTWFTKGSSLSGLSKSASSGTCFSAILAVFQPPKEKKGGSAEVVTGKKKTSPPCNLTVTLIGTEPVLIPHDPTKQEHTEKERLNYLLQTPGETVTRRPPVEVKPGQSIRLHSFEVTQSAGQKYEPGAQIRLTKCSYAISFPGNNRLPCIAISAKVFFEKPLPFDLLRQVLVHSYASKEDIVDEIQPIPESAYGKPPTQETPNEADPYSGFLATSVSSEKGVLMFDKVPTEIMWQEYKQNNSGAWIEIMNFLNYFTDIPESFVDGKGPTPVIMKCPKSLMDTPSFTSKDGSSFYCKDAGNADTNAIKNCIRDDQGCLYGANFMMERKQVFDAPMFDVSEYGICDTQLWYNVASTLFRGTSALCFVAIRPNETKTMNSYERIQMDYPFGAFSGNATLVINHLRTCEWSGLRVTMECAFKVVLSRTKDGRGGGANKSEFYTSSRFSATNMFSSSPLTAPWLSLVEFTGDLAKNFDSSEWYFFVVPCESVIPIAPDEPSVGDLTDDVILHKFDFYEKNKPGMEEANSEFVLSSWVKDEYKNKLDVRVVRKDPAY